MFDWAFILFLLGALGYVSGLLQKPWPRKVMIILFVFYLAGSLLKYKNFNETNSGPSETTEKPSTSSTPIAGIPNSYREEIDQAKDNIQKGNFEMALDNLNEAAVLDTGGANINFIKVFRIQVLIDMQDFKKALGELLQIKEADLGDNEKAWYFRYFKSCYLALGDIKKANEYDEKLEDFQHPVADISQRTKDHGCTLQGQLQDKACTPGFILTDSTEQICSKSNLKMNMDISKKDKDKVFQDYGIRRHDSRSFRIDYLIPIELGGAGNIANLWPEAVESKPGFNEKKKVEKYLFEQVCAGGMSLSRAQRMIANDWLDIYKSMK